MWPSSVRAHNLANTATPAWCRLKPSLDLSTICDPLGASHSVSTTSTCTNKEIDDLELDDDQRQHAESMPSASRRVHECRRHDTDKHHAKRFAPQQQHTVAYRLQRLQSATLRVFTTDADRPTNHEVAQGTALQASTSTSGFTLHAR